MFYEYGIILSYGQICDIIRSFYHIENGISLPLPQMCLASFSSGTITGIVEGPVELLKIQLQNQVGYGKSGQYNGTYDALKKIYQQYGLRRGIFHGTGATIIRDGPCFGVQFLIFETVRKKLAKPNQLPTHIDNFIAGACGGFGFWGILYPTEIIKTKIQADSLDIKKRKYKGWIDCFKKTINQSGGYKNLYKGYTPTILRAFPCNGAIFSSVAWAKQKLGRTDNNY